MKKMICLAIITFGLAACRARLPFDGVAFRSGGIPEAPAGAIVITDIDHATDWNVAVGGAASCPSTDPGCPAGQSPANYDPEQFVSVPSPLPGMDGMGALFSLLQSPPWADLVYGRSIGTYDSATRFIFDFWVYVTGTSAAALEYDLWQSLGGERYMIGSQCNYETRVWDGWNEAAQKWVPITPSAANNDLTCQKFAANQWHHVTWYVMRDKGVYTYLTLKVDGVEHPIDLPSFGPMNLGWSDGVGVQVQLDADKSGSPVSEYVESMSVTLW